MEAVMGSSVRCHVRRSGRGVAGGPVASIERPEVSSLLADFKRWLAVDRSLAADSVRGYGNHARKFLLSLTDPIDEALAELDGEAVISFVMHQARQTASVESTKALVTGLRSLLRFLHLKGHIPRPLAGAVPAVASWQLSGLPKALPEDQVGALLAAQDIDSPTGLRDHALLLLLARLGLRGAEAAALQLGNINWRAGEIEVIGKGSRVERLPLPAEVGEAMAAYALRARPSCDCETLFVTVRNPYRPLTSGAVRAIMGRACQRSGLPRLGAHHLRHTVATNALRTGASLVEVGQLLRHRSQLSTAIYAKVDDRRLMELVRPWPGGRP
jgi:integrase/recombinase XerD